MACNGPPLFPSLLPEYGLVKLVKLCMYVHIHMHVCKVQRFSLLMKVVFRWKLSIGESGLLMKVVYWCKLMDKSFSFVGVLNVMLKSVRGVIRRSGCRSVSFHLSVEILARGEEGGLYFSYSFGVPQKFLKSVKMVKIPLKW